MSIARHRLSTLCVLSVLAAAGADLALAQSQPDVWTTREYCVKVVPGKGPAYEAFLRDVALPLNQSRADAGEFEWHGVGRAVVPVGSSARCDYRLAYTYKGNPPEEATSDQLNAALKRAGLSLTAEQLAEKRSALIQLISMDIWYTFENLGPQWAKGSYLKFNHWNVKGGQYEEYLRLERTTWKPLMEAWLKAGGTGSWVLVGLWMPGGEAVPYNAMTIDVFPTWDGLLKGVPLDDLWSKVHPDKTVAQAMGEMDKVRSLYTQEIFRLVERVERRKAASN
jgi:hypothetical protein